MRIDRDKNGRFVPGNKAAMHHGPERMAMAPYKDIFAEAVTPERFRKLIEVVLKKAEKGDAAAAHFITKAVAGDRPIRNDVQLGPVTSTEDLMAAAASLADAVAQGKVDPDQTAQAIAALQLAKSVLVEEAMISRLESLEAKLSDGTTLGEGHSLKLALEQVEPAAVAEGQTP